MSIEKKENFGFFLQSVVWIQIENFTYIWNFSLFLIIIKNSRYKFCEI